MKKINGQNAQLIISAAHSKQFPQTNSFEVVFVGKSNVGKSSIINALAQRRRLAYVGKTPGKTRLANFYQIDEKLLFVDVPGYGFANRSKQEQDAYARLMEDYFALRDLDLMIVMVDSRRGMSKEDEMMLEIADYYGLDAFLVLSKSDKLSHSKNLAALNKCKNKYNLEVYSFSEKDRASRNKIEKAILRRFNKGR